MTTRILYRAFDKRRYAEEFMEEGKLRFCSLSYYRKIEDALRVDATEGYGHLTTDGEKMIVDLNNRTIHSVPGVEDLRVGGGVSGDYIYCFAAPESEYISDVPEEFGRYVVKILEPEQLFQDITKAVSVDPGLLRNGTIIERSCVRYDKGERQEIVTPNEKLNLSWSQKPKKFSNERELRYRFWIFPELIGNSESYFVSINSRLNYAELIVR